MTPDAWVNHQTTGRVRILIPQLKGNQSYFKTIESKLLQITGVSSCQVNPLTASVLIKHTCPLFDLKKRADEMGLFQIITRKTPLYQQPSRNISGDLVSASKRIDKEIKKLSSGEIDLRTVVAGGLFGLALLQFKKGKTLPPAMILMLQAFQVMKA